MLVVIDQRCMFYERFIVMEWITEYLLRITVASIICVLIRHMVGKQRMAGNMISIITGIFMLITVLSPLLNISFQNFSQYFEEFITPGNDLSAQAVIDAREDLKKIIKEQSEAYILEEAERMSLTLCVEVGVSDEEPPAPNHVILSGSISPYKKEYLASYICDNLGISRENLQWN